jgi:phosphate:Na+ symporter
MPYENALALAIGANIGTTITAIIGSMSANVQGKRLAGAHMIFNVVTGLIAIILIKELVLAVDWVSASVGIADDDYTLKLAVFHTIFNIVGIIAMIPFIDFLVRTLEKLLKEKELPTEQPKYLTDSALDYADTAVEAVRMETRHLYDNAAEIIIDSIGFKKAEIVSDADLDEILQKRTAIPDVNIDARYEKSIKGIYSAIIAFISKAKFAWDMEQSGDLSWLRRANINLVEAIKSTKHLQKNLLKYSQTDNEHVRREYRNIRTNLGEILRELEEIRNEEDPDMKILSMDSVRIDMDEGDENIFSEIEELIRNGQISPEMGTSLINDGAYLFETKNNLIQFFEAVFVAKERDITKVERKLALDEDEITQIREHSQEEAV